MAAMNSGLSDELLFSKHYPQLRARDVSQLSVKTEWRPHRTPVCVHDCVFSFVYMTERWKVMTCWNGPEGNTHTHTHTLTWPLEIPVTVMLQNHSIRSWKQRKALRVNPCVCVSLCVCLMFLPTKPTKILLAIKKCTALAPQLIFPGFLQLQTSRAIVISSPSVSIWMPESQLRLRLIESAPGPSHAGTQMSSARGGE